MKVTKRQLKKIIKEELQKILQEQTIAGSGWEEHQQTLARPQSPHEPVYDLDVDDAWPGQTMRPVTRPTQPRDRFPLPDLDADAGYPVYPGEGGPGLPPFTRPKPPPARFPPPPGEGGPGPEPPMGRHPVYPDDDGPGPEPPIRFPIPPPARTDPRLPWPDPDASPDYPQYPEYPEERRPPWWI